MTEEEQPLLVRHRLLRMTLPLGEITAHFLSIKVGPGIFAGAINKFNRTGEEHNTSSVALI